MDATSNPSPPQQSTSRIRRWWFPLTLIFLIALFAAVVIQRDRIRAHWWAYRLKHDDSVSQRGYYLSCIAAVGTAGTGAIESLTQANDPDVRSLAVFALRNLAEDRGVPGLARLLADTDADVREAAALGLAFKNTPAAVNALKVTAASNVTIAAKAAMTGLARIEGTETLNTLCIAATKHQMTAVRAQALESLGEQLLSLQLDSSKERFLSNESLAVALAALTTALSDDNIFMGELSLERQIRLASVFAGARDNPLSPSSNRNLQSLRQRKVSTIAARWLSKLTGHDVSSEATTQPLQNDSEKIRQYMAWYLSLQPTMQPDNE